MMISACSLFICRLGPVELDDFMMHEFAVLDLETMVEQRVPKFDEDGSSEWVQFTDHSAALGFHKVRSFPAPLFLFTVPPLQISLVHAFHPFKVRFSFFRFISPAYRIWIN